YLRGPEFEQEAEAFLNATIDNVMARSLHELIGQIDALKLEELKDQIASRLVEILRSEVLFTSLSINLSDGIDRLFPQTIGSVLQQIDSRSLDQAKRFLARGLLTLLAHDQT